MLKITTVLVSCLLITSCATTTPVLNPHSPINIYGVTLLPPQNGNWFVMTVSGYQMTLSKEGDNNNESLVANVSIYQIPEFTSDAEFFGYIKEHRATSPNIGRFDLITNAENLSSLNGAICVKHHNISQDNNAKITGCKTAVMLMENIGYNCIHPKKKSIGVNVEYSLRHFVDTEYPLLNQNAETFFNNIEFTEF